MELDAYHIFGGSSGMGQIHNTLQEKMKIKF